MGLEQRAFLQAAVGTRDLSRVLVRGFTVPGIRLVIRFDARHPRLALKTPRLVPPLLVAVVLCVFLGYTKGNCTINRFNGRIRHLLRVIVRASFATRACRCRERVALPLERLDWMVPIRTIRPSSSPFQERVSIRAYSWTTVDVVLVGFTNRHGAESVSRYGTLGNRANLHHLLATPFWIRAQEKANEHPYGFQRSRKTIYVVYESETRLPLVRTTTKNMRNSL